MKIRFIKKYLLRAGKKSSAGRIWPAGRTLPTPDIERVKLAACDPNSWVSAKFSMGGGHTILNQKSGKTYYFGRPRVGKCPLLSTPADAHGPITCQMRPEILF